jgi:flagellar hook-associated protein FlgK
MDIFMGAKAEVGSKMQFNSTTGDLLAPQKVAAVLTGKPVITSPGDIAAGTLTLNGQALPPLAGPITLDKLVDWINSSTAAEPSSSRITAAAQDGQLVLRRPAGNTTNDIRLGLGPNGTPADLMRLGFDTRISIQGTTRDDLLIFVTDRSATPQPATVTAQFTDVQADMKQSLRTTALQLRFISDTEYEITEPSSKTVLAQRSLIPDPNSATPSLSFRGLKLEFSTAPKSGDLFTIDGNRDGIGNNEAMLRLVELEKKRVMPGGLTMTEAYIERVNQVGNVARQAAIAEQALSVVYEQALESRDGISGVSLDEEASALVRFQQAYQANAKVMQTAMALFDSILQIR